MTISLYKFQNDKILADRQLKNKNINSSICVDLLRTSQGIPHAKYGVDLLGSISSLMI